MRIEHIALWVEDLEKMKEFYEKFFEVKSNGKYVNSNKNFSSYFLSFESGARIELMHKPGIVRDSKIYTEKSGLAHFAVSVGSKEKVDALTSLIRENGYSIIGEPRITGDGYYESIVSDPEGNWVEITE
jgi:lactoylglutathione lyase